PPVTTVLYTLSLHDALPICQFHRSHPAGDHGQRLAARAAAALARGHDGHPARDQCAAPRSGPWRPRLHPLARHQAGTYWYHSHSGFQEQAGLYGPLVIDPAGPEPFSYQRDHVVMLSDWTDLDPASLFTRLKKMPGHDNYYQRTVGDFFRDARRQGLGAALAERR